MWIPYYCAPGMERAVELGFDVACVQNGYAFPKEDSENGLVQPGVIADSLDIAYRYGLGAEIELQLVEDYFDRYSEYISGNYQAGVMTDSFTAVSYTHLDVYKRQTHAHHYGQRRRGRGRNVPRDDAGHRQPAAHRGRRG